MTQRVRRAERLRRHRGFVYTPARLALTSMTKVLKEAFPLGPADWPSAATVELRVMVGRIFGRRPETLLVRVGVCRGAAEAQTRALSKLRLPLDKAWLVVGAKVKPDGVPGIKSLLYRESPFVRMFSTSRQSLLDDDAAAKNDTTGTVCKCGLRGYACRRHGTITRMDGTINDSAEAKAIAMRTGGGDG